MAAELLRSGLPHPWNYGVTEDGRIFFIDDENRRTTWLHPRDGEPVQTGYRPLRDLPQGWEQGVTPEGAIYYIDHTSHSTTFVHPITKETAGVQVRLGSNEAPCIQRSPTSGEATRPSPHSALSPSSNQSAQKSPTSPMDSRKNSLKKSPGKHRVLDRHPSAKGRRNNSSEITMKGWLLKQDTGPIKNWKRRISILTDFCLFFYKDEACLQPAGSILLPSYKVNSCDKDNIANKRFAFKLEHHNMQTYYFAAETYEDMQRWLSALSLATTLQQEPSDSVDQGPPRLPDGPTTADKFLNHPARRVDENDNSVIGGNDLDDYGFPIKRYSPHQQYATPDSYDDSHIEQGGYQNHRPSNQAASGGYPDRGSDAYCDQRPLPGSGGDVRRYNADTYGNNTYPKSANDMGYNVQPGDRDRYRNDGRGMSDRNGEQGPPYRGLDYGDPRSEQNPNSVKDLGRASYDSSNGGLSKYSHYIQGGPGAKYKSNSDSFQNYSQNKLESSNDSYDGPYSPHRREDALLKRPTEETMFGGNERPGSRDSYDAMPSLYNERVQQPLESQGHSGFRNSSYSGPTPYCSRFNNGDSLPGSGAFQESIHRGSQPLHHQEPAGYLDQQVPENTRQFDGHPRDKDPESENHHLSVQRPRGYDSMNKSYIYDNGKRLTNVEEEDSDSVFTDTSNPQAVRHEKFMPVQNLEYLSASVGGSRNGTVEHPLHYDMKSNGARYDTDQGSQPYAASGPHDMPLSKGGPSLGHIIYQNGEKPSRYDGGRDEWGLSDNANSRIDNPSNSSQDRIVQTSPKRPLDLSIDTKSTEHIYENVPSITGESPNRSFEGDDIPNRPPLPAAYRDQIIRELAQTKTPHTFEDYINAAENEAERYTRQSYFQFPESPPTNQQNAPTFRIVEDLGNSRHSSDQDAAQEPDRPPPGNLSSGDKMNNRNKDMDKQGSYGTQRSPEQPQGHPPGELQDSLRRNKNQFFKPLSDPFHTIKEDPDMPDSDVLETKYGSLRKTYSVTPLNGHKLRLSIQPGDLAGKSHEELVLLLIQLRREQAKLERSRDTFRKLVDQRRDQERLYRSLRKNSPGRLDDSYEEQHEKFQQIKYRQEELEKYVEVHKPLVNLVDNLVKMGSLYSGQTDMLMSEYKKHLLAPDQVTPPTKMLEFSRQLQEDKLMNDHKEELKNLREEEIDLEEKMKQLYALDRELQELSVKVTSLQEDKRMLEVTMREVEQDQRRYKDDSRELERLSQEYRVLERQLFNVVHQLAENSKVLEEVTAENTKVEMEVAMLRSKVYDLSKSGSTPTLSNESYRAKMKLENELTKVQDIMVGLNQQGQQLSEAMDTLRKSNPDVTAPGSSYEKNGTYLETDLDSKITRDIAVRTPTPSSSLRRSYSDRDSLRSSRDDLYPSDADTDLDLRDADENTKKYFGFLPKDKYRAQTVRDVKRESERRSRGKDRRTPDEIEPSSRFQGPVRRTQSLPRNLEGPMDRPYAPSPYSQQPHPHGTHDLTSSKSSLPSERPGYYGSNQTLPSKWSGQPPEPDLMRQVSSDLEHQPAIPMQKKQLSSSYEILDQSSPARAVNQKPLSASHEILNRHPSYSDTNPPQQQGYRPSAYTGAPGQVPTVRQSYPTAAKTRPYSDGMRQEHSPPVQTWQRPADRAEPRAENSGAHAHPEVTRKEQYSTERAPLASNYPKQSGYGTLDRTKGYGTLEHPGRRHDEQQWSGDPPSPETEIKQPFPSEESVVKNSYHESQPKQMARAGSYDEYLSRPSKPTDSIKRQSAPQYLQSYPVPYSLPSRTQPGDSYHDSGAHSPNVSNQPRFLKQTKHPVSSDFGQNKPFGSSGGQKQYQPQRLSPADAQSSHSQGSPVPSSHSPRYSHDSQPWPQGRTQESPLLRRAATLPVTKSGNVKSEHPSSATDRLFPKGSYSNSPRSSATHSPKIMHRSLSSDSPQPSADARPVYTDRPAYGRTESEKKTTYDEPKRDTRGRHMTIASSHPARMEYEYDTKMNGYDKIEGSEDAELSEKVRALGRKYSIDDTTIDREVLFSPDKVDIPERYIPEEDEELTEEEKVKREKKVERIRKILSAQSLQEWTKAEIDDNGNSIHETVSEEKKRREGVLEMREKLAKQVTKKSKQVAVEANKKQRRKTWSGSGLRSWSDAEG